MNEQTQSSANLQTAQAYINTAEQVPDKITKEDDAKKATDLIGMMSHLMKSLKVDREDTWRAFEEENDEYQAAVASVAQYTEAMDRLDLVLKQIKGRLLEFMKTRNDPKPLRGDIKSTASLVSKETVELVNRNAIPATALREMMTDEEILKLAKRHFKETGEVLKGCRKIDEKSVTVR